MTAPLLDAEITSFTFHGEDVPALYRLAVSAAAGALTTVLGGSGSGKSTLGRVLGGWLRPGDAGILHGRLSLNSRLALQGSAAAAGGLTLHGSGTAPGSALQCGDGSGHRRIDFAAWCRHVAYVPQDPASMLSTVSATVAEELAFGLENAGVPRAEMLRQVRQNAGLLGLTALLDRDPATLSGGELRRLALGCALIGYPDVLILDEPLASLDTDGAARLRTLIRGLTEAGTAVVQLSQRVDSLALSAERWIVLDAGTVTAAGSPDAVAASPQLAATGVVVGPPPGSARPHRAAPAPAEAGAVPLLEVRGLVFGYPAARAPAPLLSGLDLVVHAGETVAITGPNGAGKSTLLRSLNGLLRPASGEVRVRGASIAGIPTGLLAREIGLLFQHPRDQLFERTVRREVGFGLRKLLGRERAAARAAEALAAVGLSGAAAAHPAELPASQQRLLALATVLAREPAVLALDEPTVGLDRHGLEALQSAADAAAARGAAVVLVTHDLAYARRAAHRVLELRDGRLRDR